MSAESHLMELKKKHETLTKQIENEQQSPASDDLAISELKRKKLRLKEQIAKINTTLH